MTRRDVRSYGSHGATVNTWLEGGRVWVEWRDAHKKRHTKSWPEDKAHEARRWAQLYAAERARLQKVAGPIPAVTELWETYRTANAPSWRPKTRKLYAEWAVMLGLLTKPVDQLTHADADGVRDALREKGIAHGTIRRLLGFLRQMLAFAVGRQILPTHPLAHYRYVTPKDERSEPPAEYTRDEITRLIAALDRPSHWRARVVLRLGATFGGRINALRHLRWEDIDFDQNTVTFQARWDKTGETFTRPMPDLARTALLEARNHRHPSGWVLWSPRSGEPITYNALHYHLTEAEKRAGVAHRHKRAFHGQRRMVVGNLGDVQLAGQWLNQKTPAVTQGYMRERPEDLERARKRLG